jgi:hypothetical protein
VKESNIIHKVNFFQNVPIRLSNAHVI